MKKSHLVSLIAVAGLLLLVVAIIVVKVRPAADQAASDRSPKIEPGLPADRSDGVAELINNEELIRELDPILGQLTRAALNLQILNAETSAHFSKDCRIRDILAIEQSANSSILGSQTFEITTSGMATFDDAAKANGIWSVLLSSIDYFDQAKFYTIRIADRSSLPASVTSKVGFESLGKTVRGTWMAVSAQGTLTWKSNGAGGWEIETWDIGNFEALESRQRIFEDATARSLSPSDYLQTQRSDHRDIIVNAALVGRQAWANPRQEKYFPRGGMTGQHPSISVVDIDNDGWDDFYMVEPWGKNMLFRNRGDGTFEEVAGQYGLDVSGNDCVALFADFDNDGDQDLFLGRVLQRSIYLENQGGKFVDRSRDKFPFALPFLVTSVSAADYNRDGLLDLYVCTYGMHKQPQKWIREFFSPEEAEYLLQAYQSEDHHRYLNATGPRNLLLENTGQGFELSPFADQVATWANTFQGTWADFDNDGDPDLYVANDFARDYLFRNDREAGFTDVTLEIGDETMMGFGMGVSWGDYDLDGQLDLYVSNMYSKAGIRITEHFEGLDKQFRRAADGNRLYQNKDGRLSLVSANEGPGLKVHKAGWSWGGQFMDFDNDGFLDLYVCSGYFTAPKMFATDLDL